MVVHREGYRWFKLPLFVFVLVSQILSLSPSVSWAEVAHDCICPFDETILTNPGTQSCGQINCPACGHHLVRALYVGPKPDGVFQNKNTFDQPPTGATGGLTREPRTWVPDPVGGALTIAAGGAPGVPPSNITGSTGKRVGRDLADRNEKVLPSGIFQNSGSHEHSI